LVTNKVLGSQSVQSINVTTPNSKIIRLDQKSVDKMKQLPHVARTGTSYSFAGSLQAQGGEVDTIVYGGDTVYQQMENLILHAGRLLKPEDGKSVLLNSASVRAIGIKTPQEAVGKKLTLRIPLVGATKSEINDTFTIVGVINSEGGNESFINARLFIDAGVPVFHQVRVEADAPQNVAGLRKQIESLGFATTSPLDTIDQINEIFKFFNIILAGFGAVGMIVAVLGMFNTLTISLLERTKEIGLMVALGGRNRDMRKLFIFEAVLLSVVGSVVGIVLAVIFGQIINVIMNAFARGRGVTESFQLFATPWWLVVGMILFMVAIGLLVVYYPARRASNIQPIDALRRE
ncbi:MAG TPA: FtsX-like permease family protein, partial [Candidatus Saccharimonadales bacterium]|nr:FtsX-like permease family protein [Candidatus Saccharimonadales bacterium]